MESLRERRSSSSRGNSTSRTIHDPSPEGSVADAPVHGGLEAWREAFRVRHAAIPSVWVQVVVALALAVGLTFAFFGLDLLNLSRQRAGAWIWDPCLACEARIPYAPTWIWVYIAYYPLCFSPVLLPEIRKERGAFWRTVGAYLLQFGLGFVFFWLVPSRMTRPLAAGEGLTRTAMEWTYLIDPGFNIFPSLHVSILVFTCWIFGRFQGKAGGLLLWTATALVTASTLLVKQHCLVDLVAAAVLGTATFFLCFPSRPAKPPPAQWV
jgi:membrane-associated phospholipid phosphatase